MPGNRESSDKPTIALHLPKKIASTNPFALAHSTYPSKKLLLLSSFREPAGIAQLRNIPHILNANPRAANLLPRQNLFIHFSELSRTSNPMLLRRFIDLDPESKQDLVDTDIRLPVITASSDDHGEQGTLRHGWHRIQCYITLRPSTNGPSAVCVLLEKITDGVAVCAWEVIISCETKHQ